MAVYVTDLISPTSPQSFKWLDPMQPERPSAPSSAGAASSVSGDDASSGEAPPSCRALDKPRHPDRSRDLFGVQLEQLKINTPRGEDPSTASRWCTATAATWWPDPWRRWCATWYRRPSTTRTAPTSSPSC
ncbi:Protein of unknown function [Gryllus bimaculatus]|nr:Protein of unknown function [Gryllus bimaculatus]